MMEWRWRHRGGRVLAAGIGILALCGGTAAIVFRPQPIPPAPRLETLGASAQEGRYLATLGNCVQCHTAPGGKPYAGGARFETPFGVLYSTNITQDRKQGIGGWTFADFHRAMRHGIRADGAHLYPAFPYTSFARLSDRDIASLYLHFRSIGPVASAPPDNAMRFPFDDRRLLYFWNRLFHDGQSLAPVAGKSAQWNRGAYLVRGITAKPATRLATFWGDRRRAGSLKGVSMWIRFAEGSTSAGRP